ncbi:hypothetical protein I4U23_024134 [Adineta vaga]|nr:hypothetical protein I4U23_024134 [Adineta vaga]
MSLFYLIVYIGIGVIILGLDLFSRWINQTYQIQIRTCPNGFCIEFKRITNIQVLTWFENRINRFIETFHSLNNQCTITQLNWNFNFIFLPLRYLWLTISILYSCFILKRTMVLKTKELI